MTFAPPGPILQPDPDFSAHADRDESGGSIIESDGTPALTPDLAIDGVGPFVRRVHYDLGGRPVAFDLVVARPLEWAAWDGREGAGWTVEPFADRVVAWRAIEAIEASEAVGGDVQIVDATARTFESARWATFGREGVPVATMGVMARSTWMALPVAERPGGWWSSDGGHLMAEWPAGAVPSVVRTEPGDDAAGPLKSAHRRWAEAAAETHRASWFEPDDHPGGMTPAEHRAWTTRAVDAESDARHALLVLIAALSGFDLATVPSNLELEMTAVMARVREGRHLFLIEVDSPDADPGRWYRPAIVEGVFPC